eukprot:11080414-Alexandrium_andersonii.AAC.1
MPTLFGCPCLWQGRFQGPEMAFRGWLWPAVRITCLVGPAPAPAVQASLEGRGREKNLSLIHI